MRANVRGDGRVNRTWTAEWRFGSAFSPAALTRTMATLPMRPRTSTGADPLAGTDPAWNHYHSEAIVAREPPGPPLADGPFARARVFVARYEFSDPRIVCGHFDPAVPLLGRPMLLEVRVLGLRYLCPVVVREVRDQQLDEFTEYGFCYETLAGHIEEGAEWFLLRKDHRSGEVTFRIQAAWRHGQFPTWWSRVGFALVGRRYQRAWHRLGYVRLRLLLGMRDLPALPRARRIVRAGLPLPAPPVSALAGKPSPTALVGRSEEGQ